MNHLLKKLIPASAASLIAFTATLSADGAAAAPVDPACIATPPCPTGCINPPARPEVQCGWNLYITADLLWWSAYEYGLDYAISTKNSHTNIFDGNVMQEGNDYDWAFRFGVGYNLPHDGWDLYANWTFFNSEVTDKTNRNYEGGLFPTCIQPSGLNHASESPVYAGKADAKWTAEMNIIDLELGREFYTCKYLTLRPHVGFRYASIDQRWTTKYEGGSFDFHHLRYNVRNSNDFWGFGLRGGLNTQWGIGGGFSIYGDFALSLLLGHFHISQVNYLRNIENHERTPVMDFNNRNRVGRAVTDIALGVRYDAMFADDRFHLGLQLGWEHHMFWGLNQMWHMSNSYQPALHSKHNDEFATQGWTLSARFDF